jgi:hypothetical protein
MLFRAEAEWSMGRTELAIQDTADLLSRALANANIFEREIYGFAVLVNFRLAAGVIDGGWADGREALLRAQFRTNFDIHLGHSLKIMALISALRADAEISAIVGAVDAIYGRSRIDVPPDAGGAESFGRRQLGLDPVWWTPR